MANLDPASQAQNARGLVKKRVNAAALTLPSPEMEDALALQAQLDDDVVAKLMSGKELPPGDQYKEARENAVLSMQARHDLIIKLFAQGMRKERIARSLGVSTSLVNRVLGAYFIRKEQELRTQRMDEFVLHMAEGYIEDMDRLSDVIMRTNNAGAIIGAIKARNDAREKYTNLLADFGFIARKPQEFHISGENVTVDARQQNVIVVSQDELRSFTSKLVAAKRSDTVEGDAKDVEIEEDGGNSLVITGSDH